VRFSLRSLLAATGAAAVLCTVFFWLPIGWSVVSLMVLALMLLSASAAGIAFASGYARAFAIGYAVAGMWIVATLGIYLAIVFMEDAGRITWFSPPDAELEQRVFVLKLLFAGYFATNFVGGLVSMGIRWLCLRAASDRQRLAG
jgi:hypothetical protein